MWKTPDISCHELVSQKIGNLIRIPEMQKRIPF